MAKNKAFALGLFFLAGGVTAFVGLIATSGTIPKWAVGLLGVLTGGFFSAAVDQFQWARKAPYKIGRPIRAVFIHGLIWAGSFSTVLMVLPPPPIPHIHITGISFSVPDDAMGRAEAKVVFANNGEAPARLLSGGRMAWYLDRGVMQERWSFEESLFRDEPNVEDVNSLRFDVPFGSDRSIVLTSSKWDASAVKAFSDGNGTVYAAGTIFYAVGNDLCMTRYCMYMGKDGNGKFCLRHNEEPKCR